MRLLRNSSVLPVASVTWCRSERPVCEGVRGDGHDISVRNRIRRRAHERFM